MIGEKRANTEGVTHTDFSIVMGYDNHFTNGRAPAHFRCQNEQNVVDKNAKDERKKKKGGKKKR